MSADLHIHVLEGITEREVKLSKCDSFGSKYFDLNKYNDYMKISDEIDDKLYETPNIWIGEVSWLKASIFNDKKTFVPGLIEIVSEIVGEDFPIIDNYFIEKILNSFNCDNITNYRISKKEDVREFLEKHKGKKVFTISW